MKSTVRFVVYGFCILKQNLHPKKIACMLWNIFKLKLTTILIATDKVVVMDTCYCSFAKGYWTRVFHRNAIVCTFT